MHIEEYQHDNFLRNLARLSFATIGFLFGFGFMVVGGITYFDPHGPCIPIAIFASPLGVLEGVFGDSFLGCFEAVFLWGSPFHWSIIGFLSCEMLISGSKRGPFLVVMGLHFGCLPWLLSEGMFGDWAFFWRVYSILPTTCTTGFALYGLAQILAWSCFVVACVKRPPRFGIRTLLVVTLLFAIWLSWAVIVVRDPFDRADPDQIPEANSAEECCVQPKRIFQLDTRVPKHVRY